MLRTILHLLGEQYFIYWGRSVDSGTLARALYAPRYDSSPRLQPPGGFLVYEVLRGEAIGAKFSSRRVSAESASGAILQNAEYGSLNSSLSLCHKGN